MFVDLAEGDRTGRTADSVVKRERPCATQTLLEGRRKRFFCHAHADVIANCLEAITVVSP